VLVQYTALAWSSRGFPFRFPSLLRSLQRCGARIAVVYHDAEPYEGRRLIDRVRRAAQLRTMRKALRIADAAILTVRGEKLSWLGGAVPHNAVFIPVGANLPTDEASIELRAPEGAKTVAVFGVTGGSTGLREVQEIVAAVRFAAARVQPLRLVVLGRETEQFAKAFADALRDANVTVEVLGARSGEEVVRTLRDADVALFVRSELSSRRSSAIAAIACGVPLVARAGAETAAPMTEAGVAFYSRQDPDEPGTTLTRVLLEDAYRAELAAKNTRVHQEHLSWSAIARKYVVALTRINS